MSTPTGRTGYPAYTFSDDMDGPAQITAEGSHFDAMIGEEVATASALPASGNWVGRTIHVADEGDFRVCTALPSTWVSPTPSATRFKGSILTSAGITATTNLDFTTIVEDTASGWSTTNKNYVIPFAGTYLIIAAVKANASITGGIGLFLMKNNTKVYAAPNGPAQQFSGAQLTHYEACAAGDTVAVQTSVAFTTQSDSPAHNTVLEVIRIA